MEKEKIKKILKIVLVVFVVLIALAFWYEKDFYFLEDEDDLAGLPCYKSYDVATIEIKGEIVPYFVYMPAADASGDSGSSDAVSSEEVIDCIDDIKQDGNIKTVILEINSYGGSPVASEEIMNAIKGLSKPSIAVIREAATSGGYLIASATDRIFASELSDIGGIGVTMSYLDYSKQNSRDGITYNELSSAKFKNTGDSDKPLTAEEKALIQRDLKILHEAFVKNISKNRKLDISKVEKLADGSSMLGQMAKENGLIDEIGDRNSAEEWINR